MTEESRLYQRAETPDTDPRDETDTGDGPLLEWALRLQETGQKLERLSRHADPDDIDASVRTDEFVLRMTWTLPSGEGEEDE